MRQRSIVSWPGLSVVGLLLVLGLSILVAPVPLSHPGLRFFNDHPSRAKEYLSAPPGIPSLTGGYVTSTLSLLNGTFFSGNVPLPQVVGPTALAYDPALSSVVVTGSTSDSIVALNTSSGNMTRNAPTGNTPVAVAYDSFNGEVYVANLGSGTVGVYNGSTLQSLLNVTVGSGPDALTVDPATGNVYVADFKSNQVTVLDGKTNSVASTVSVGSTPTALAYDPLAHVVVVANGGSNNLSLINATTGTVSGSIPTGTFPHAVSFDAANGRTYVANEMSANLSVFNASGGLVATVSLGPAGTYPFAEALNPTGSLLCITESGNNQVSLLNTTTDNITATLGTGNEPEPVTYDPIPVAFLAGNYLSNNLTIISATTLAVSAYPLGTAPLGITVDDAVGEAFVAESLTGELGILGTTPHSYLYRAQVGASPTAVALDASGGNLWVANNGSGNLSVVQSSTGKLVATVPIGNGSPDAVAVDPVNDRIFVANYESDNLTVISGTSYRTLGSIPIGNGSDGIAYDPLNGDLYVANFGSDNVSVVSGITDNVVGAIPVGGGPIGVAYDPYSESICVADSLSNNLSVIPSGGLRVTENLSVGIHPSGVGVDPTTGAVYVANSGSNNLTVLQGNTFASVGSVSVGASPDSLAFSPTADLLYVSDANSGAVSYVVPFQLPSLYSVTFQEQGLPAGIPWTVTLGSLRAPGNTTSHSFVAANGTYPYSVSTTPKYVPTPALGQAIVQGQALTLVIVFSLAPPPTFGVYFAETGLPPTVPWTVSVGPRTLNGTNGTLATNLTNGSYSFNIHPVPGYQVTPQNGTLQVNGSLVRVNVTFTNSSGGLGTLYRVAFEESGLPGGFNWSVRVNGHAYYSTSDTLIVPEPNGSYSFRALAGGFEVTPSTGTFLVKGQNVTRTLVFAIPAITLPVPLPVAVFLGTLVGIFVLLTYYFARDTQPPPKKEEEPAPKSPGEIASGEVEEVPPEMAPPAEGTAVELAEMPPEETPQFLGESQVEEGVGYLPERSYSDSLEQVYLGGPQGPSGEGAGEPSLTEEVPMEAPRKCFNCGSELQGNYCPFCNLTIEWMPPEGDSGGEP